MAIIGKIRDRSGLLLVVMAVTLLLFILSDALTNFRGGGEEITTASVFDEPISPQDLDFYYYQKAQQRIDQENMSRMQNNQQPLDENSSDMFREQLWNEFIKDKIYEHELAALGLISIEVVKGKTEINYQITPDELNALFFTQGAHPIIKRIEIFQDSATKKFMPEKVIRFRNKDVQENKQVAAQWALIEQEVKKQVTRDKYLNMVTKGIYVTKAESKRDYDANNKKYKIKLVAARIDNISDSAVKVSESDIKAVYEKLKYRKQYENTNGSTKFELVEFPIIPSQKDVEDLMEELDGLKESFKNTDNDSSFIKTYADSKENTMPQPGMSHMYPKDIDSLIQLSDSGAVLGPYEDPMSKRMGKSVFKLIKITSMDGTQKEVKARHILLNKDSGDSKKLLARADSLKKVIKANNNFVAMVAEYSGDFGSAQQGGDLGWFTEGMMVTEFNDACFKGKVGDMPIVETQFGVHLIEILGQRDAKKVQFVTVDKRLEAGDETIDAARTKAQEFFEKVTTAEQFTKVAQKRGLQIQEKELLKKQKFIEQNPASRELSRRIHESGNGDIIEPIVFGDNVVVACIKSVREEGVPSLEDVRPIMEAEARREKKLDLVAKQVKGSKTLADAAQRANTNILDMDVTFASNALPGLGGAELEVIGTIFSFSKKDINKISTPIRGKNGIYMFQLVGIDDAPATKDYKANKQTMETTLRARARNAMNDEGDIYNALKKLANVVDNRELYN